MGIPLTDLKYVRSNIKKQMSQSNIIDISENIKKSGRMAKDNFGIALIIKKQKTLSCGMVW